MPNQAPVLPDEQLARELRRDRAAAHPRRGAARGEHLPLLLRRALHHRLPHPHRRPRLHQEDRQRQPARRRPRHPRRQSVRPLLRPRLPRRGAVRGRLRPQSSGTSSRSRSRCCSATPPTTCWRTASGCSQPGPPNGKRVAVVGAGPAGLVVRARAACAGATRSRCSRRKTAARRAQHLRHRRIQDDARRGARRGARTSSTWASSCETGVTVGRDVLVRARCSTDYDAVFVGVGLGLTNRLGIPGEDLPGRGRRADVHRAPEDPSVPRDARGPAGRGHRRRQHGDRRRHPGEAPRRRARDDRVPSRRGRHALLRLRVRAGQRDGCVFRFHCTPTAHPRCAPTSRDSRWSTREGIEVIAVRHGHHGPRAGRP